MDSSSENQFTFPIDPSLSLMENWIAASKTKWDYRLLNDLMLILGKEDVQSNANLKDAAYLMHEFERWKIENLQFQTLYSSILVFSRHAAKTIKLENENKSDFDSVKEFLDGLANMCPMGFIDPNTTKYAAAFLRLLDAQIQIVGEKEPAWLDEASSGILNCLTPILNINFQRYSHVDAQGNAFLVLARMRETLIPPITYEESEAVENLKYFTIEDLVTEINHKVKNRADFINAEGVMGAIAAAARKALNHQNARLICLPRDDDLINFARDVRPLLAKYAHLIDLQKTEQDIIGLSNSSNKVVISGFCLHEGGTSREMQKIEINMAETVRNLMKLGFSGEEEIKNIVEGKRPAWASSPPFDKTKISDFTLADCLRLSGFSESYFAPEAIQAPVPYSVERIEAVFLNMRGSGHNLARNLKFYFDAPKDKELMQRTVEFFEMKFAEERLKETTEISGKNAFKQSTNTTQNRNLTIDSIRLRQM